MVKVESFRAGNENVGLVVSLLMLQLGEVGLDLRFEALLGI
jgi:hypothetical protein